MPYYELGTLAGKYANLGTPIERLRIFLAICEGVAYAHDKQLIHRDLKPDNIFMASATVPVVGDFGLVYRADEDNDGRNTVTSEAVGARKYMPPEWREGRVDDPQPTGDIYSLGKILYWMFQGRVFDGNEDDHSEIHPIVKIHAVLQNKSEAPAGWTIAHAFAGELVAETVKKMPDKRIRSVSQLIDRVKGAIDRAESGGRPLDFNLPKRCLFCATGNYELPKNTPFFDRQDRSSRRQKAGEVFAFSSVQESVRRDLGFGSLTPGAYPVLLVCDVCGNIQYFRFDLTRDTWGKEWNP